MWYYINKKGVRKPDTIIAISETGMCLLKNGTIRESSYRDTVRVNGKLTRIYRIIADVFLVTVKKKDQIQVDHITHEPVGMNINDVRNLRWCTNYENNNFEEHRENLKKANIDRNETWRKKLSESHKGKPAWNKGKKGLQTAWNKGLSGEEYLSHFKSRTFNNNRP